MGFEPTHPRGTGTSSQRVYHSTTCAINKEVRAEAREGITYATKYGLA